MPTSLPKSLPNAESIEHVDVLFVGAGISGIGGARHFKSNFPDQRFIVLDDQDNFGGTWWSHRYPGIRSDSDLYTFGYRFKPWVGAPIATAQEIRNYMGEVIEENGLAPHIRYRHKVRTAAWSTEHARWTVRGERTDDGQPFTLTANFLWMGQGYYRQDMGYMPEWPGTAKFRGPIIHPQQWPEDLDVAGKRIVLIGSGATAATMVPALAKTCEQVTMLQRSPTYYVSGRNANDMADRLRALDISEDWIHEIVRRQLLKDRQDLVRRSMEQPEQVREELLAGVMAQLESEDLVSKHFTPSYMPWRQRVAFVPDGDLFKAIKSGKAAVVTDHIECFEENGIRLKSGGLLEADIIVAATGLELVNMGGISVSVDGTPIDFSKAIAYHGTMFTGVPNLLWVFGYLRASWTLRVDLLADLFARLRRHMDVLGQTQVTPTLRPEDADMTVLPWIEPSNFNAGYVGRFIDRMPLQGDRAPWRHSQDYWADLKTLPSIDLDDSALVYGGAAAHR